MILRPHKAVEFAFDLLLLTLLGRLDVIIASAGWPSIHKHAEGLPCIVHISTQPTDEQANKSSLPLIEAGKRLSSEIN
jgi:hypothetical protein